MTVGWIVDIKETIKKIKGIASGTKQWNVNENAILLHEANSW